MYICMRMLCWCVGSGPSDMRGRAEGSGVASRTRVFSEWERIPEGAV